MNYRGVPTTTETARRFDRCRNRSRIGILIAEDIRDRVMSCPVPENFYDNARRGAWYEYIGDFRLLADLDGVEEAYADARAIYEGAGDPSTVYSEQEHQWLISYFEQIVAALGDDIRGDRYLSSDFTFTEWIDYKQAHLPELLERLLEHGSWDFESE